MQQAKAGRSSICRWLNHFLCNKEDVCSVTHGGFTAFLMS